MDQHESPSKPFLAKTHRVPLPTSPISPSLPERPEARHRRDGAAKRSTWLWVWGQQKSRSLQGPSAFTRLCSLHTHTHTHTHRIQHTPQAEGESTQSSLREKWGDRDCDSSELHSPFLSRLHLFSFSSLLRATSCTCDTTDRLMLHYTYTSLSLCASLAAMFPDVASKLGHEHDTQTHRKEWWRYEALHNMHFVLHCFLNMKHHQVNHCMCFCLSQRDNVIKHWLSS